MEAAEPELPLTGGHTPGVVRVGDTVRRPLTPGSERIHRLLTHFETCRFDGAPRFLGIDARRREILSFIDGFALPHNAISNSRGGRSSPRAPSRSSCVSRRQARKLATSLAAAAAALQ